MPKNNETASVLTKRELIAAMALQGLLANPNEYSDHATIEAAVEYADALIKKLDQTAQ